MLEVAHFRMVAATHSEGSLTRAADRLNLSQSALSHRLRSLEDHLGAKIFHRVGKSMKLTREGHVILGTAQRVLAEIEDAEAELSDLIKGAVGRLRISVRCYTAYHWLPALCSQFRQEHPMIVVDLVTEASKKPIDALLKGEIDLAITHEAVDNDLLLTRPLFKDEKVALVSPDHPFAKRKWLDARDFENVHLFVHSSKTDGFIDRILTPAGIRPHRVSEVQTTDGIRELVKAGLGVGVMARWAASPDLDAGRLKAVRITEIGMRRCWSAAFLKDYKHPDYLWAFVDLLEQTDFSETTFASTAKACVA